MGCSSIKKSDLIFFCIIYLGDSHSSSAAQQVSKVVSQIIFFGLNSKFGTLWWDLCDRFCHITMLKAVKEGSNAPNLRQSCAKYIGTPTKIINKRIIDVKMPPLSPKSMLSVSMGALGVWYSNSKNLIFLQFFFEKFKFLKRLKCKFFCLPPLPQYQCWSFPESRTPYDQHW